MRKETRKAIGRGLSLFLAVMLVFTMGLPAVFADEEGGTPRPSDTTKVKPEFELVGGGNLGSFNTFGQKEFRLNIKNISKFTASDIKIDLLPPKDSNIKTFISKDFQRRNITLRSSQAYEAVLPFTLNEAVEQKTYDMTLQITYKNMYNDSFTQEIPVFFYAENDRQVPVIGITEVKTEREIIDSNSPQKLSLKVENRGDLRAKSVTVQVNGFSPKTVDLVGDVNQRKVGTLAKGMFQVLEFNVIASKEIEKNPELEVKISYVDDIDKTHERVQTILLPTSASGQGALGNIVMTFSKENYEVRGESKASASLTVENKGATSYKDLELKLTAEGGVKFMSKYLDIIKELKPGEKKTYNYTLASADPAQEGNFPITATLKTLGENPKQIIQVAGVTTYKKDDEKKGGKKPKIIIADYSFTGEKIFAGKEFELKMVFKNTSQTMGVKNVKFTFTSDEGMFIPIDSANSFFIDRIQPGQTAEHTIKLRSKPEAAVKMYNITFVGEYEDMNGVSYDEKGNPYKAEELISLNVRQEVRLQTAEMAIPEINSVGFPIPMDLEFYNLGKGTLYNLIVKLEGDFDKDGGTYFVGNFEAAKSDIFSTKIIPTKAGENKGKVVFTFEDEAGHPSEIVKEFKFTAEEATFPDQSELEKMGNPGEGGTGDAEIPQFDENGNPISNGPNWLLIGGVALAAVAVVVFIVVLKKKKAAKAKTLLEEDDEDK